MLAVFSLLLTKEELQRTIIGLHFVVLIKHKIYITYIVLHAHLYQ